MDRFVAACQCLVKSAEATCPFCACGPKVLTTHTGENASCQDLPEGSMMVTDFVAGGGCYGSPPARTFLA